jgi:Holliday junction resolvasome RuvABC DNA-binding subunit
MKGQVTKRASPEKGKPTYLVLIGYKDKKEVKQKLRMIAARQGHGSISRIIRDAVKYYLEN